MVETSFFQYNCPSYFVCLMFSACSRHVLRFSVTSPLGYQLHLCSTVNFIFGDAEKVVVELTKVCHY